MAGAGGMIAGVVLAGGRSRRFGGPEKAVVLVEGAPLISRAVEVLANGCGAMAVNAPPESSASGWADLVGLPTLPDADDARRGPVAGVLAGLAWAEAQGYALLAVVPCDALELPRDLVARLAGSLTPDAGAAVARDADGLQPACAVWRVARRAQVAAALADAAGPSLREVLAQVAAVEVLFEDPARFADADTPEDLKPYGEDAPATSVGEGPLAGAGRIAGFTAVLAAVLAGLFLLGGLTLLAQPGPGAGPARLPQKLLAVAVLGVAVAYVPLMRWVARRVLAPGTTVRLTSGPARRI